jgi:Zn-dependent peptidase ImmA (M78 family)/transcriptional regulator with XRE-family HTH domain
VSLQPEQVGLSLKTARERARLSQESVAAALGFNRVLLSYYESGKRIPSLSVVSALAGLYGLTVDAILSSHPSEQVPSLSGLDLTGALFRSAPSVMTEGSHAGMRLFAKYVTAYVQLIDELGESVPGKGVSDFSQVKGRSSKKEAARLAREVREYLGLGAGPVGDLLSILGERLLVFRLPMGDLEHYPSGFFYNHEKVGFCIVVNSTAYYGRQLFTLAHELAHAYFHSQGNDLLISWEGAPQVQESFANAFASELLIPSDTLSKTLDQWAAWEHLEDPAVVIQLQRQFGVSYAAMLLRLLQEGLIEQRHYEHLSQVAPTKLARALGYPADPCDERGEVNPLDRFPPKMLRLVRSAILKDQITDGDAAETLGVSLEDIGHLVQDPRAGERERRSLKELSKAFGF